MTESPFLYRKRGLLHFNRSSSMKTAPAVIRLQAFYKNLEKKVIKMNILGMILLGICGLFGITLVGGTVVGMIGVIICKIYRSLRYHISLYD